MHGIGRGCGPESVAGGVAVDRAAIPPSFASLARIVVLCLLLAATCLFGRSAVAQEVRLQIGRGPHYVGESIEVQVVASDFAEDPTPEIEVGEVTLGRLRYAGVSDSSSTSISIINGRMSRVKEVHFIYRYEFSSNQAGRVRLPSFRVTQAGEAGKAPTTRQTRPFDLEISGVPATGLVALTVEHPEGPIFVGQKVPIEVELRIDREAQRDLLSYQATVPLFDHPSLRFLDETSADANGQLEIETAAGTMRLPATSTEEDVNGRRVLFLRARRTMIALSPEEIRAPPPRVVISRGTRFRRDLFNQRQATSSQRLMAEGNPIRIEVVQVPREGRPPSFAGAVGKGFSLEVAADRSVVQVGEPILLSFHLRGDGDLSSASLPPLDAEGLFDPNQFRLPEDPPAGLVDEDGKHFDASVRVLDAEAREVPAIAYTWFDAETRAFETTYSRPIALSVGAAEIIGADAVARREGSGGDPMGGSRYDASTPRAAAELPVRSTSLAFSGANLAVDEDVERVLASGLDAGLPPLSVPALYLLGTGLLVLATLDRRRQAIDPGQFVRARAWREAERAIEAAIAGGGGASASLGRALRELVAALPEEADAEFDALIAECDALRFAPEASGADLPAALASGARRFLSRRRDGAKPDAEGDR
ncbi:MAG: hypothetical protein CL933_20485 [Deltaproteobacteria bacterium]|nr:hypothetical protein [Deltaproteobacteria bacterium]